MAARKWTLVELNDTYGGEQPYVIHKPGCKRIKDEWPQALGKEIVTADLELPDDELIEVLDPGGDTEIDMYELCACTGYVDEATQPVAPQPPKVHAAAEASKAAAAERLQKAVEEIVEKLVAARGVDDVGLGGDPTWAEERLATCKDDYVYDLAVEVRKLRNKGESWWRVGYELDLPGSGPSNKQGRKGGAFARRLWRAAWGKTYTDEDVVVKRESKTTREARAMENLGRPYFSEEATELEVIQKVTGQMIHWVARLNGKHGMITSAQEAYVHDDPRLVKYRLGPQGPYIEFFEQVDPNQLKVDPRLSIAKSGPLRAVYVDRITRVGV